MSCVTILVGAQWGDEGKGKWIDILSKDSNLVARYQGGNNAGHTIYINGEKIVLHQIPSGIFQKGVNCALAAGVVFNPVEFTKELKDVSSKASVSTDNLWVSARAHVITPWHIHLDAQKEAQSSKPIGTTKRGIGPTYSDKSSRTGLRVGEFVKSEGRKNWILKMSSSSKEFESFYKNNSKLWADFEEAAELVSKFVCDAELKIRSAIEKNQEVLLEGAQGALLDIDHGTYPYVTSSSTAAGGAIASIGFSPKKIKDIFGIAKAYTTRVGEGPFPTELFDETGKHLASKGNEFGATTGRPRRCGWLDLVALKYCGRFNGLDGIVLNKLDILSGLKEIKFAVEYEHKNFGRMTDFPSDVEILSECKPVYKSFKGWDEELPHSGKISALPKNARAYIDAIEEYVQCPVKMVGTGVNRSDALFKS